MKIKLARGPMANKRVVTTDNSCYEYRVQEPLQRSIDLFRTAYDLDDPYESIEFRYREGSYHRSNVTLKDGTVVFEWMGWRS